MNIQRAIKSGKPFSRPEYNFWIIIKDNRFLSYPKTITTGVCGKTYLMTIKFDLKGKGKKKKMEAIESNWQKMPMQPVYLLPSSVLANDWIIESKS